MDPSVKVAVTVAEQFGNLIARGNYTGAHTLLSKDAQKIHSSPHHLRWAVEEMTGYAPGPIRRVELCDYSIIDAWPAKQDADIASVFVGLIGDDFTEAVTVIVVGEAGEIRIRELQWGRP
jgi:hypothetical protein